MDFVNGICGGRPPLDTVFARRRSREHRLGGIHFQEGLFGNGVFPLKN